MWIDVLKAFFIGVIQGITEWLPISSTGHMILFNQFFPMQVSDAFMEMFRVVIQFGSILAVLVLYFDRLNPWSKKKTAGQKTRTWRLWGKVVLAAVPAGIFGVLFDDWMDAHFYTYVGTHENAHKLMAEIGFPEELILSTSAEKVKQHLKK